MESFLKNIATKIVNEEYYGPDSLVILPNRRSEVFLKNEIGNVTDKSIWLPDFYPVDKLIQNLAGINTAHPISLSLDLYSVYKNIEKEQARDIDEFLTWAPLIINDFNDIDNAMANASDVYRDLTSIKEIEHWDPSKKPLTNLQKGYLNFYRSMFKYYNGLYEIMNRKQMGYNGFINRYLAENITLITIPWSRILVVGLNALTEAELLIFDYINKNCNTHFEWDIDNYYLNKTSAGIINEAGIYIKDIVKRLKLDLPHNIPNNLTESPKNIRIIGAQKSISQVKFIGQELNKLNINDLDNTAIILGNEGLTLPLIHSLPNKNGFKYNITLGYPTANSQADYFFSTLMELLERGSKTDKFETSSLINFFHNNIVSLLLGERCCQQTIKYLLIHGRASTGINDLTRILKEYKAGNNEFVGLVFSLDHKTDFQKKLILLKELLINFSSELKTQNNLVVEEFKTMISIVSTINQYIKEYKEVLTYNTIRKIGRQLFLQSNINLVGEPLEGIQIMGMLESRALDFENIYLISVNEGMIPKTSSIDSFIPYDLRSMNKLPLPAYKTGIYAYHFFRLLQRSKNITILYSTEGDKLGGGEKSRFVLQLEDELAPLNKHINISHSHLKTSADLAGNKLITDKLVIYKTSEILKSISALPLKGYSSSLLTTYITCSLKFYYSYILQIKPEISSYQDIEANIFGIAVHGVLENIYKQFEGDKIKTSVLERYVGNLRKMLEKEFYEQMPGINLFSGKNLLLFEVANAHINGLLNWEISRLKRESYILISAEQKINRPVNPDNRTMLKGVIDRIDKNENDNLYRIIDYKTGKVSQADLNIKDIDSLYLSTKYLKAFQLLFYGLLFENDKKDKNLKAGIISTRNISSGFIPLKINGYDDPFDYLDEFRNKVLGIIQNIENPDAPFQATNDIDRCKFCDYRSICNRY